MDQLNQNKNQEKVKSILEHETRRAVNADSIKKDSVLGKEYYSVKQTQKDNAFIEKILKGGVELEDLSEKDKIRLLNVQSRNKSHLLVNDYKTFSFDGGKMKSVKENIFALERALSKKEIDDKTIKDVILYFETSIMACETYVENKHPWFPKGKSRKRQVEERLRTLREEKELFEWGVSALKKGLNDTEPKSHVDIIDLGRMQKSAAEKNAKEFGDHFENLKNFAVTATTEKFGPADLSKTADETKLSEGAQAEFKAFYNSRDLLEVIQTNIRTDGWAKYGWLKEKNTWFNEPIVLQANDVYKLIHSDDEEKKVAYQKNKKEIDDTFDLFEKEMRTIDMFSFFQFVMQNRRLSIEDESVKDEVSDMLVNYYELQQKTEALASEHADKIKKLMGVL